MDALIQNAGTRFQKAFADEPLLERLRILARDDTVDADVRQKANVLFRSWAVAYKGTPGLERIAALHKELPRTKRPQPQQSRIVRQQDAEAAREREEQSPSPPRNRRPEPPHTSSSRTSAPVVLGPGAPLPSSSLFKRDKKDKKKTKRQPFNLEKEKGQMLETIASANVASTNLLNGLQLINREQQRVSDNAEVMRRFETCKQLRRQILRYIHLVESEQYIGGLLNANDELVKGLMAFELMDKSIDDDSDSDNEAGNVSAAEAAMANMNVNESAPPKPPRPTSIPMPPTVSGKQRVESESEPEEDEDDPFGDSNAVKTPFAETGQPTWRDV
ncbi:vhs domain-containing protein [Stemphylium lycopersici]|uniref:Vhs domain-containing protein n=1 Tax=Stemphylium lycopersici TaxID=183478 RepID=A0A364N8C0_STELY|nr:vhs domain-containing protein [Stemphylium lycopersici]RAR13568.1 vhs domain-containing protein [Stemphylium lycopersici]